MLRRTWSLQRVDLELLVLKLRELYSSESSDELLYPVVKVGKVEIRGPPINERFLKYLEPIPNRRRFLALDSSLKILLDLSFCKIIVAKVSIGIWYRGRRIYSPEPKIRITIVRNKSEAGEWLLGVELEEASRYIRKLGVKDYCLLDRGLITYPRISNTLKLIMKRIFKKSIDLGIFLVGIPKRSSIRLSNGLNALSFINKMACKKFPGMAWYYYPLFEERPDVIFGSSAIVKFSEESNIVFRVDLVGRDIDVGVVLGEVSYLQDVSLPGYPYPLKAVHEEARISEFELECLRGMVLDLLEDEGLIGYVMNDLNTTNFRERYLWG